MANTRETMGEQACLDALVADTLEVFEDDGVIRVNNLKRHNSLRQVTLPNATTLKQSGMASCGSLESVTAPNVTTLEASVFYEDGSLTSVSLGNVSEVGTYCFNKCYSLSSLSMGHPTEISSYAFQMCYRLDKDSIDFSVVTRLGNNATADSGIGELILPVCRTLGDYAGLGSRASVIDINPTFSISANKFSNARALCHLILRNTDGVATLTNTAALSATGIASGVGWIYVPTDLVDSYKAASNWSSYASQIVSISEYPKALQDETVSDSWATIAASSTYATDYPIGSVKYVNIGGTRLAMQLVATNTDDLASGGKARMTWISRDALDRLPLDHTNTTSGGWATCELRDYLRTCILPQMEQDVRTEIKQVTKTYHDGSTTQSIADTLWIPSIREVGNGTTVSYRESSGCDYGTFFADNSSRIKKRGIGGSASAWWLREISSSGTQGYSINSGGSLPNGTSNISVSNGVVLGFCI